MSSVSDKLDVVLNVGGVKFRTPMETVKGILDGEKFRKKDLRGPTSTARYIDRDPKVFGYILNYLREGSLILPRDGCLLAQIKLEAKFYGITDLVEKIDAAFSYYIGLDYIRVPPRVN